MPDTLIIGAGPAGSTAAIVLARAGIRVTLIEQHHFPRDKVCGECLSPLAIEVLSRLNLMPEVRRAGAIELRRSVLHAQAGDCVEIVLPRPMFALSRLRLDELLLAAARRAGAEILQPVRCEQIDDSGAELRDLETNRVFRRDADRIWLADGKAAFAMHRPTPTGDFGLKAHFENVDGPSDSVELFSLRGHYVGLTPIEDGRFNLAFSVPQRRLRLARDLNDVLQQAMKENRALRRRMLGARRVSDWLVSPLPRFPVVGDYPPNVTAIGNAAAALEPIGGEGMGLAMRSAEIAAASLISGARTPVSVQFDRLWRNKRIAYRAMAKCLSHAWMARIGIELVGTFPQLSTKATGWLQQVTHESPQALALEEERLAAAPQ